MNTLGLEITNEVLVIELSALVETNAEEFATHLALRHGVKLLKGCKNLSGSF